MLSSLELSDTQVYEPYIRTLRGTAAHFCKVVVLQVRTVRIGTAQGLGRGNLPEPDCSASSADFFFGAEIGAISCNSFLRIRSLDPVQFLLFFFFTLVTGPRRSLSLKLSDTRVCEPQIRFNFTPGRLLSGPFTGAALQARTFCLSQLTTETVNFRIHRRVSE